MLTVGCYRLQDAQVKCHSGQEVRVYAQTQSARLSLSLFGGSGVAECRKEYSALRCRGLARKLCWNCVLPDTLVLPRHSEGRPVSLLYCWQAKARQKVLLGHSEAPCTAKLMTHQTLSGVMRHVSSVHASPQHVGVKVVLNALHCFVLRLLNCAWDRQSCEVMKGQAKEGAQQDPNHYFVYYRVWVCERMQKERAAQQRTFS